VVDDVLARKTRPSARLMRLVDDDPVAARPILAKLYPHAVGTKIIGITGNPGAGKSTLTARVVAAYREQGKRVGVVAVDPSSPFTGGAILGDRIRMMEHAADPHVFIRSVASRGALGGVSRSTEDIARVMGAMGHDVVIVETVGVGQAEVEIVTFADTVLVVMTPGYGDDVQALKAGLLEIADAFVVNKSDHPGADGLVKQLRALWRLKTEHESGEWEPPVLKTVATENKGIDALIGAVAAHTEFLNTTPEGLERRRRHAERTIERLLEDHVRREAAARYGAWQGRAEAIRAVMEGERSPYDALEELLADPDG